MTDTHELGCKIIMMIAVIAMGSIIGVLSKEHAKPSKKIHWPKEPQPTPVCYDCRFHSVPMESRS